MSKFVLSTMTNDVAYCFYQETGDLPVVKKSIIVRGGAGLPSISNGFGAMTKTEEGVPMWTPDGVVTPIKDSDIQELMNHPIFKKHQAGNMVRIIDRDITDNHGAVKKEVTTMLARDQFAQLTPETYKTRVKVTMPGRGEEDNYL